MHYFIVNVSSRTGKAKDIWCELERKLKADEVSYQAYLTEYVGHATELATMISTLDEEEISLIVVGGDGTANEVINGLRNLEKIRFGYIPTGSGNDLGRGLGMKGSSLQILDRILNRRGRFLMDLGQVSYRNENRYFAISSGIGIDAVVCEMALHSKLKKVLNAIGLGKLTYLCLTLKALFSMPEAKLKLILDDGEVRLIPRMIFTVAMNHKWEGGGVPMAPNASACDGKLSMCCVYGFTRGKALLALPALVSGKHETLDGFEVIDCKECRIEIDRPMVVHADGEYCGLQTAISFTCIPQALEFYGISDE